MRREAKTRVCFVTGTRAEFGLMRSVLRAIQAHPKLKLQLAVTGMHLQERHGKSIDTIRAEGWNVDTAVPWRAGENPTAQARSTGAALAGLAVKFEQLKSDIVLVTGDRIEAFAAAAAAHVSHRVVAHIHGGDRAPGQVDDSLRHAITKLAHIHFPATAQSEARIVKLGEDRFRIHRIGAPGIDGIARSAATRRQVAARFPNIDAQKFALIVLHPVDASELVEAHRAAEALRAVQRSGIKQTVVVYPNSDPGSGGIIRCWQRNRDSITYLLKDLPRPMFLGLMRDAAVLVGNSSSGIIEAASFGTPVMDIGPRQQGRERSENVTNVPYGEAQIAAAIKRIWNNGRPRRWRGRNVYGRGVDTGTRIAAILASLDPHDPRILRKLIAY